MAIDQTFTVTVVSTGSGNKYAIDGVQQDTIMIGAGLTYKFDQSNGTNSSHPLRFSTNDNNSPSAPYTTGVTASGIPGNSGAYTQIEVAADAPSTLYYYCTNHSGMGGQANTDGWGRSMWGQADWGDTNIVEQGWGRLGWGEDMWGDVPLVLLPALSATTTLGELTTEVKPGWGTLTWGQNGWGSVEAAQFTLPGLSLTASVGQVTAEDVVGLTALPILQTSVNAFAAVSTDVNLTLTGLPLTITPGLLTTDDHSVGLPALTVLQTAVGSITPSDVIGLTALTVLQTEVGSFTITSDPVTDVSGLSATTSLGTLSASPETIQILSGQTGTTALGTVQTTQVSNVNELPGLVATTGLNGDGLGFIYNRRLTPKTSGGYTRLVPKTSAGYTRKTP